MKSIKLGKLKFWLQYKLWVEINYYLWRNPKRIVMNFWNFRKEIYNFRDFDYSYNFALFNKSLLLTAEAINKRGLVTKHKEVHDEIKRFIELYNKIQDDVDYFEIAGGDWDKVGLNVKNGYNDKEWNEIRKKERKLKEKDLEELSKIIKNFEKWWD